MRILLLRHGQTKGNQEHRYVGRTDEDLLPEVWVEMAKNRETFRECLSEYIGIDMPECFRGKELSRISSDFLLWQEAHIRLLCSPMNRALDTAMLLFPDFIRKKVPDFREMDFGRFEYKNYTELVADPETAADYQRFIDSCGECGFPEGERKAEFTERVCRAYQRELKEFLTEAAQLKKTWMARGGAAEAASAAAKAGQDGALVIVAHGGVLMAILERFAEPHKSYYDWQCGCLCGFAGELLPDGRIRNIEKVEL